MAKSALPGFLLLSGNMVLESKTLAATGMARAQAGHVIWNLRGEVAALCTFPGTEKEGIRQRESELLTQLSIEAFLRARPTLCLPSSNSSISGCRLKTPAQISTTFFGGYIMPDP